MDCDFREIPQKRHFSNFGVIFFCKNRKVWFICLLHKDSTPESLDAFAVTFLNHSVIVVYLKARGEVSMVKTAEILVALVNESAKKPNADISREILVELQKIQQAIPWVEKVLLVNVNE